jgi:hypothetical protein
MLYVTRVVGFLDERAIAGDGNFPSTQGYLLTNFNPLAVKNERIPLPRYGISLKHEKPSDSRGVNQIQATVREHQLPK